MMKNKFIEKIISRKIQSINAGVLLLCAVLSTFATLIPPIDSWLKDNNIYVMLCYLLATLIGAMVFSIFEHVCRLKPIENSYQPIKELGKLLSRLNDDLCVDVYFGLDDTALLNQLIEFLNRHISISSKYQIFIQSSMIGSIGNENYFSSYHFNLSCNIPNVILIHAKHNSYDNVAQSFFIRHSANGEFEYIAMDSEDEIMHTLTDIFFDHVKSIHLSDSFVSKAMRYIFDINCSTHNDLIDNKCLAIYGRDVFFKYMTDILENCTSNIYAIDFIRPEYWIDYNQTREYGLAHKDIKATEKQRIHIIDLESIKNLSDADKSKEIIIYNQYATFMRNDCGVQLFFLELSRFDSIKYEKRGCLILDNECVFVAINPGDGAPMGEIDFNVQKINKYKDRFDDCLKSAHPADEFLQNILSKV